MFCHIRYILILKKDKEIKISGAEDKIRMYIVSNIQPHIRYIMGDMIRQS